MSWMDALGSFGGGTGGTGTGGSSAPAEGGGFGGGAGGTSVQSDAGAGQSDYGAANAFGDARIQITGPILNFGGGAINPGSLENGGDDRGLPNTPGYSMLPGSTYDGALSRGIPVSYSTAGYGVNGGLQPAFFDTINEGPLSGSGNTIVIVGIAAVLLGVVFFVKTGF